MLNEKSKVVIGVEQRGGEYVPILDELSVSDAMKRVAQRALKFSSDPAFFEQLEMFILNVCLYLRNSEHWDYNRDNLIAALLCCDAEDEKGQHSTLIRVLNPVEEESDDFIVGREGRKGDCPMQGPITTAVSEQEAYMMYAFHHVRDSEEMGAPRIPKADFMQLIPAALTQNDQFEIFADVCLSDGAWQSVAREIDA